MRTIVRPAALLLATAMMVLAPTISLGGNGVEGHKGPFDIDPRSAEPDTDFGLSVARGDGDPCGDLLVSGPGDGQPTAVLLGNGPNVHVQVVDGEGVVLESEDYTPDGDGDWASPVPIPLNLAPGTYLVTAECTRAGDPRLSLSMGSTASSASEPAFVLLGVNGEEPRCTEVEGEQRDDSFDGCYEPQELVIEVAAAEPVEREPTFTG